ncbi:MAG: hypothetical protein LBC68_08680 [Prevotellaceae bacterium]|jgi:hypothetical protein|nr:hypothetical protein [Prevotellaceae bacterium]
MKFKLQIDKIKTQDVRRQFLTIEKVQALYNILCRELLLKFVIKRIKRLLAGIFKREQIGRSQSRIAIFVPNRFTI